MAQHQQPSLPEAMAQHQQHQQRAVTALHHQQRVATVLHHLQKQVATELLLHRQQRVAMALHHLRKLVVTALLLRQQESPLQENKRSSDYGAIKQYAMDSR